MTVVTFALPDESRNFVARLGPARRPLWPGGGDALTGTLGTLGPGAVAAVHVGVGESPSRREAFERFLGEAVPRVRLLIVSGFAGALRPGVAVGDLVLGENHSAATLLGPVRAALAGEPLHVGRIRTERSALETAAAKAAMFAATAGAVAVDMETAWVAAAAARGGVPATLSLRVVSDAADQDFPVPGGVMFDPVRQRPRYLALPAYLAMHPGRVGPFVRFVRGLGPARARLAGALVKTIAALANGADGGLPRP